MCKEFQEGNTRLERYLSRYEDGIKTGRKEILWENFGSVHLAQDRHARSDVVSVVANFGV
jgi:hypothetical protein